MPYKVTKMKIKKLSLKVDNALENIFFYKIAFYKIYI